MNAIPEVIIIGIGFATRLGLIRAVAQTGAEIDVIAIGEKKNTIDRSSRYIRRFFPCKSNDESQLLQILTEQCIRPGHQPILIPANDFPSLVLDKHLDLLEQHFIMPHIHHKQGAVGMWMNKGRQKAAAKDVGLNTVEAIEVTIKDSAFVLPDNVSFPCFTKTIAFMPGYKHTLHRCNDRGELAAFLQQLADRFTNITVMVEAFKEIETEYAVVGFTDGKQVTIPGVIEVLTMGKGSDMGVTLQGEIKPRTGFEEVLGQFERLMAQIGFVGLFDIDFYQSGGKFYFCEINFRIGGSATALYKCGVNLPAMFVRYISGLPYEGLNCAITEKKTFVNDKISLDCWYAGHLTLCEYKCLRQTSDFSFIDDDDDPAPGRVLRRRFAQRKIKKMVKNLLSPIKRTGFVS